jgi:hypothetical protein
MKYIKTLFYCSIILISCETPTSSADNQGSDKTEGLKKTFNPIIDGIWVETTYIEDISRTKSPSKSQDSLSSMVELDIETNEITGDSLEVGAPSIHEGTSFILYFRQGTKETSLPTNIVDYDTRTNFYEFGYVIMNNDTALVIYHFDKNRKLLDETKYIKVPKNSEGALQYMVNKTLFSGIYDASDTAGNKMKIRFTNDGSVKGLPNFKRYYVLTDFVAEPENKLDEVCFDIQTKNQTCYAYKIIGDTINLYETTENEEDSLPGSLKYRLVKQ